LFAFAWAIRFPQFNVIYPCSNRQKLFKIWKPKCYAAVVHSFLYGYGGEIIPNFLEPKFWPCHFEKEKAAFVHDPSG
jgi:hypothetical protein